MFRRAQPVVQQDETIQDDNDLLAVGFTGDAALGVIENTVDGYVDTHRQFDSTTMDPKADIGIPHEAPSSDAVDTTDVLGYVYIYNFIANTYV
jgi:hypothetical protein